MFSAKVAIFLAAVAVCYGAPNAKFSNNGLNIYPGDEVKIEDYPYVASVQYCSRTYGYCAHTCGGVIVNENWVLTSADCVFEAHKVMVGDSNLQGNDTVSINIESKHSHPNSTDRLGPNDIALLKLSEPLTFNERVQAAKLPEQGQEFNGTAVVTGYSMAYFPNFNTLRATLNATLVSNDDCNKALSTLSRINEDVHSYEDSNLCTLDDVSTTCQGDVGGSLSQDGTVIGFVTWYVSPCYLMGGPNAYTKLSNFVDWINQTITENS